MTIELAWAAGFFDGEGYTGCARMPNGGRRLDVVIAQVNVDHLRRFRSAVGERGTIRGPRQEHPRGRPIYRFVAVGASADAVLTLLWPFLTGEKRDQAIRALIAYAFRPMRHRADLPVCQRGHAMADAYHGPDGHRQCRTCRLLRRSGPLEVPPAPLAIEIGVGVRQYEPPPLTERQYAPARET